uniref:Uncharacterized protein n=1 Tax=Glossina austeni TaxID=7395 RepID=A0A1A9UYJ2_GLOAU
MFANVISDQRFTKEKRCLKIVVGIKINHALQSAIPSTFRNQDGAFGLQPNLCFFPTPSCSFGFELQQQIWFAQRSNRFVSGEIRGAIELEVIECCCDPKVGVNSRYLDLINEYRESTLISLFSLSKYLKDSTRKTSSCFKCEAPSTEAAKRRGSRNLVIIFHCLQSGLDAYFRRFSKAFVVSSTPCAPNSSIVSKRILRRNFLNQ